MALTERIQGEGWTLTYTLLDENDNPVDASALKLTWRPFNQGSDFPAFAYVFGSDARISQTGSGVYVYTSQGDEAPNVYDLEWYSWGGNDDVKRTTLRVKERIA